MGMTKRNARSEIGERPTSIKRIPTRLKLALGALTLLMVSGVLAQSGGGYDLHRWTVAGGGAISSGGGAYALGSTVGQTGAGTLNGGSFTIYGGFWKPGTVVIAPPPSPVYVPIAIRALPPPPTPTPTLPPPPIACPDVEPNEDPEHGQQLTTINRGCIGSFQAEPVGRVDFYWVRPNSGQHIIVDLTSIPSGANYDINLIKEESPGNYFTVAASANPGQANEHVDYVADSNKRYFIRVRATAKSTSANNTYILTVAIP